MATARTQSFDPIVTTFLHLDLLFFFFPPCALPSSSRCAERTPVASGLHGAAHAHLGEGAREQLQVGRRRTRHIRPLSSRAARAVVPAAAAARAAAAVVAASLPAASVATGAGSTSTGVPMLKVKGVRSH